MNNLTFHRAGIEIVIPTDSIHFVQARSFGDVTFGSLLVTPHKVFEVDESLTVVLELIKLAKAATKHMVDSLDTLEEYNSLFYRS